MALPAFSLAGFLFLNHESSPRAAALTRTHTLTKCRGVFFLLEKSKVKEKLNRKKLVIPQIIITTASGETLIGLSSIEGQEQRTIQERTEGGPYSRHRNPSTVDAYGLQIKEHMTAPE